LVKVLSKSIDLAQIFPPNLYLKHNFMVDSQAIADDTTCHMNGTKAMGGKKVKMTPTRAK
jgi:hypothetical protein